MGPNEEVGAHQRQVNPTDEMKSRSLAASLQGYSSRTNHHEMYRPKNRSAFFCTNSGYRKDFLDSGAVAQDPSYLSG